MDIKHQDPKEENVSGENEPKGECRFERWCKEQGIACKGQ